MKNPNNLVPITAIFFSLFISAESAGLFLNSTFLLVPEDWQVGTVLPIEICPGNVKILSGDSSNYFSVVKSNSSCASLQLDQPLDADKENSDGVRGQSFSLVIGGPRKSRATLEVQVVDVNDNAPQFIQTPSKFSISESTPVGTVLFKIRTRDPDTGISGISRFSIDDDHFALERRKCNGGVCSTTLRLAKPLDYETQPVYHLTVTAKDGDPHSNKTNTVSHAITIELVDENDEPPQFVDLPSEVVEIDEGAAVGDVVYTMVAENSGDAKSKIIYTCDPDDYFTCETTGEVKIKKMPKTGETVKITVKASDERKPSQVSEGVLKFSVESSAKKEENLTKSEEQCEVPLYEGRLLEGEGRFESPLIIKTASGTAEDLQLFGGLDLFELKDQGNGLYEIVVIEAEKVANQNFNNAQLLIKGARGKCRVTLYSVSSPSTKVMSRLKPKFERDSFLFYVTENHKPTVLGKVKMVGEETVSYSIVGDHSDLFAINADGEFRSLKPIDREQFDKFELIIRAVNENGDTTDAPGTVVVRDINDNSPIFEKDLVEVTVDEGKSVKQMILATDRDLGPNAEIVYSIDDQPESLPVDISNGILFIGPLDRDTMESGQVNLTLRATDKGDPPRSSTTKVVINVKDVNDNWPVFSNSRYSIVLDANISPGGVVGAVKAEDADSTSPNNYINYSSQDTRFRITDDGEIIFVGPGTLSKDESVEFTVAAADGGNPSHNSTAVIILNEHKAAMQSELTTHVNSNETHTTAEINWTNSNMPGYVYEIVKATAEGFEDSEVKQWIQINRDTGKIVTTRSIDPHKVKQIRLHISMTKGKREVPVELIINVMDTDEVTPQYNKTTTFAATVSESTTPGSVLVVATADGVTPDDGVKYTIQVTKGPKNKLRIDRVGNIRLEKALDYEKENRIEGVVIASFKQKQAAAKFKIFIEDENDNRPVFKNSSVFITQIYESSVMGTVLDLPYPLATDADSSKFATLVYSMTGDHGYFRIDPANSTIRLISSLDYETQRIHSLSVKCVDNDGKAPFHEVFASVTVYVLDANDNPPLVHNTDLLQLTVGEDAVAEHVVTTLTISGIDPKFSRLMASSDADEEGKQKFTAELRNTTLFKVDDKMRIVVAEKLDGQAGQRQCASLVVTDVGFPKQNTTKQVCVTIYPAKDNHHNPLIVSPKPNSIHYYDENVAYEELLRIKVLEEGAEDELTFKFDETFKKDWQSFMINATGSLKAKAPFDFEKKTVHEIKVMACRKSNCASLHLFLSVNDRNDNCPMFPQQDVKLSVTENEKGERQVGRIPAALDSDFHSDNTKVCYTTETPLFYFIDPTLPMLYTNSSFDREQKSQHQITIIAYDCHLECRDPHKPMNGTIIAMVDVIDVNDNFPKFEQKAWQATVVQGQANAGSLLLTVKATDGDEEKEGVRYAIRGLIKGHSQTYTQTDAPISIDEVTGEITANRVLKDQSFEFTVTVLDGARHEDTATVLISVVTYAQQTELVFDAPFELISKSEKSITEMLSNATSLQAVVDRTRQNNNFTLMLVHFVDEQSNFVNVDKAVHLLMTSSTPARRDLRSQYGLREAFPPVPVPSKIPQIVVVGSITLLVIIVLSIFIWCRQRNSYDEKLRQISAQTHAVHTVTLGRPLSKNSSPYGDVMITPHKVVTTRLIAAHPAPPPPTNLQSTEL